METTVVDSRSLHLRLPPPPPVGLGRRGGGAAAFRSGLHLLAGWGRGVRPKAWRKVISKNLLWAFC